MDAGRFSHNSFTAALAVCCLGLLSCWEMSPDPSGQNGILFSGIILKRDWMYTMTVIFIKQEKEHASLSFHFIFWTEGQILFNHLGLVWKPVVDSLTPLLSERSRTGCARDGLWWSSGWGIWRSRLPTCSLSCPACWQILTQLPSAGPEGTIQTTMQLKSQLLICKFLTMVQLWHRNVKLISFLKRCPPHEPTSCRAPL